MNQEIFEQINLLFESGHLPNAILIVSANKVHTSEFAKQLASRILDTQPVESHPDFIFSSATKAEEVREVLERLALSSFNNRVVVLNEAENLTPEAVNILLKNIEEPNNRTYFIVLSAHEEKLLPTLRSRLMAFRARSSQVAENVTGQEFVQAKNTVERLQVVTTLDPHEDDILDFLKYLYTAETKDGNLGKSVRLKTLLKCFEYLAANVKAERLLSYLALKW